MAVTSDVKKCPKCKLINPPETQCCDCGYNFDNRIGGVKRLGFFDYKGREAAFITSFSVIIVSLAFLAAAITRNERMMYALGPLMLVFVITAYVSAFVYWRFALIFLALRIQRRKKEQEELKKKRENWFR